MAFDLLKLLLPKRPMPTRIWRGPFRGACIVMNPRDSLRKILGVYEHELNPWLEQALRRVTRVLDVGANDGYFTFGCAAAFRRLGKAGEIVAFEPQPEHVLKLRESVKDQPASPTQITLVQSLVGLREAPGMTTLESIHWSTNGEKTRIGALVKIDVEGAEMEVLAGAPSWLRPENLFVIEVHEKEFLETIPRLFAARGLILDRIDQRPLRWLGREVRELENWWLASRLG